MKVRNELNYQLFIRKTGDIKRYPLNEEIKCYTDISADYRSFDLSDMLKARELSENSVRNAMYHFVIFAHELERVCMENGLGHDEAYTLADIYIRKADKCCTCDGITALLGEMKQDFCERMGEIKKEQVISLHVRKCIDYIYEHLGETLTVNYLAGYCGLNPSYLSKLFYSETGTHLKQFVLEAKIDTAQNLLKYSKLSYLDISVSLGFSTQSMFIQTFKKFSGMTPKKYRETNYVSNQ